MTTVVSEPLLILLVEDDDQLRESLREVLDEEGYEVVAVPSGAEAIARCAERKFDLIVTDIKTPDTDGLSALEKVKEGDPEVAGIVITGYSTEEYALRAARLRVENYLKKPFQLEEFLSAVDRLAEKKRREQKERRREVTVQKAFSWLLLHLAQSRHEREREELERFLERAVSTAPVSCRDSRERAALECLSLLHLADCDWPLEFNTVFPTRIQQALSGSASRPLTDHFRSSVACFLDGRELETSGPDEPGEDDSGYLPGSLLNMALLLESTQRLAEAMEAFDNVLKVSEDPYERFTAHFGVARIARSQRRFEELQRHLSLATEEARKLGPLTHAQALAERAVLLARAGSEEAGTALNQAEQTARELRETGSFALISLAQEYFQRRPNPKRARQLAYLARPESFSLAVDSSEWLLALLLSQSELNPEERRFLTKLVRSCPKAFRDLLLRSDDMTVLSQSVRYLDLLDRAAQERVARRFQSLERPELAAQLAKRSGSGKRSVRKGSTVRVFSFSGIRLFRDDEALEVSRKKPLLLFLYLLYRNGPVGEEHLAELFWPGPEARGRASLRTALSYLRKLLAPEGNGDPFIRQAGGVGLADELSVWFDHREFEKQVKVGKSFSKTNLERSMECFRAAAKLYRGPFLENIYEEWANNARTQAELALEDCLRFLARQHIRAKNWAEGLEHAARGWRRDPLSQPFCEMTMQCLIELGRHHDALQSFEQCKSSLWRELELEPSIEMIRLKELALLNV